jgi:hypothetical protein
MRHYECVGAVELAQGALNLGPRCRAFRVRGVHRSCGISGTASRIYCMATASDGNRRWTRATSTVTSRNPMSSYAAASMAGSPSANKPGSPNGARGVPAQRPAIAKGRAVNGHSSAVARTKAANFLPPLSAQWMSAIARVRSGMSMSASLEMAASNESGSRSRSRASRTRVSTFWSPACAAAAAASASIRTAMSVATTAPVGPTRRAAASVCSRCQRPRRGHDGQRRPWPSQAFARSGAPVTSRGSRRCGVSPRRPPTIHTCR